MSLNETKQIIDRLAGKTLRTPEVQALLRHKSAIVRAKAIECIGRRIESEPALVHDLVSAFYLDKNQVRLMGTISIRQIAVEWLLRSKSQVAMEEVKSLLQGMESQEKQDLVWYLKSLDLDLPVSFNV